MARSLPVEELADLCDGSQSCRGRVGRRGGGVGVNLIVVALIIPVIAAIQLVLGRSLYTNRSASYVGAGAMAASFAALVGAWALRDDGERWAGLVDVVWIETLGARFHLGLDGISWPLALMAALLAILACLSLGDDAPDGSTPTLVSWSPRARHRQARDTPGSPAMPPSGRVATRCHPV